MVAISPFDGQVVRQGRAGEVISPAYDALSSEQRRRFRLEHPLSYLHVTRTAEDEPDAATVDQSTLVARGRASLEQLIEADVFAPNPGPRYLAYELDTGDHRQRGLVCEVIAHEFQARAKPHEAIHPERARLLAEHFQVVQAASSPVACTVADGGPIAEVLAQLDGADPLLEQRGADGLIQRVWQLEADGAAQAAEQAMAGSDLYIVDGHHRAAANAALLELGIDVPLLVTIFAPESLRLAGFHRLVKLPAGLSDAEFVAGVGRRFATTRVAEPFEPTAGTVALRSAGDWHRVAFDERPVTGSAQVRLGSLDPAVVEREIVSAIAGRDQPADVAYLAGDQSLETVAAASPDRVAILVPPVTVADMIEVADGGLTMPAKSTYFTPKVRSGLLLRRY